MVYTPQEKLSSAQPDRVKRPGPHVDVSIVVCIYKSDYFAKRRTLKEIGSPITNMCTSRPKIRS